MIEKNTLPHSHIDTDRNPLTKQLDLETETSKESIIEKAKTIKASVLTEIVDKLGWEDLEDIDLEFANIFRKTLKEVTLEPTINGKQILAAYEAAVLLIEKSISKQFSGSMLKSAAVGKLCSYLGIPTDKNLIVSLKGKRDDLVEKYEEMAKEWEISVKQINNKDNAEIDVLEEQKMRDDLLTYQKLIKGSGPHSKLGMFYRKQVTRINSLLDEKVNT